MAKGPKYAGTCGIYVVVDKGDQQWVLAHRRSRQVSHRNSIATPGATVRRKDCGDGFDIGAKVAAVNGLKGEAGIFLEPREESRMITLPVQECELPYGEGSHRNFGVSLSHFPTMEGPDESRKHEMVEDGMKGIGSKAADGYHAWVELRKLLDHPDLLPSCRLPLAFMAKPDPKMEARAGSSSSRSPRRELSGRGRGAEGVRHRPRWRVKREEHVEEDSDLSSAGEGQANAASRSKDGRFQRSMRESQPQRFRRPLRVKEERLEESPEEFFAIKQAGAGSDAEAGEDGTKTRSWNQSDVWWDRKEGSPRLSRTASCAFFLVVDTRAEDEPFRGRYVLVNKRLSTTEDNEGRLRVHDPNTVAVPFGFVRRSDYDSCNDRDADRREAKLSDACFDAAAESLWHTVGFELEPMEKAVIKLEGDLGIAAFGPERHRNFALVLTSFPELDGAHPVKPVEMRHGYWAACRKGAIPTADGYSAWIEIDILLRWPDLMPCCRKPLQQLVERDESTEGLRHARTRELDDQAHPRSSRRRQG